MRPGRHELDRLARPRHSVLRPTLTRRSFIRQRMLPRPLKSVKMRASLAILLIAAASAASAKTPAISGTRPTRLIIRNATIVDGNGTPARGPFDIVLQGTTITQIVALDPVALRREGSSRRPRADAGTA